MAAKAKRKVVAVVVETKREETWGFYDIPFTGGVWSQATADYSLEYFSVGRKAWLAIESMELTDHLRITLPDGAKLGVREEWLGSCEFRKLPKGT